MGVDSNCPSRPSSRDDFELSRLLGAGFQMGRLLADDFKRRQLWESARDSNHLLPLPRWTGWSTVAAWPSLPRLRGAGMATVRRSLEISIVARHCCHGCPDLSPHGRHTMPTTAYLYGPEMVGPARQRGYRRRRERHKDGPVGVGPLESAGPSHGPRTPLTRQDGNGNSDRPPGGGTVATTP